MSKKISLKRVPNFLSGYRLAVLPVIIGAIFTGHRDLFFVLLMVSLVTDILDGLIARAFRLETELGAFLDSTADMGTYLSAVLGFVLLEKHFIQVHNLLFIALVCCYLLPQVTAFIRFGRNTSYHLYSNKITGYVQGIFVLLYYLEKAPDIYFYFMIVFSCLAYLESFVITLFIPKLRSNVKSIYFMFKEHGRIV